MQLLDNLAAQKPQLSGLELGLLTASIAATASSPFMFAGAFAEVLPPTAAACELFDPLFIGTIEHEKLTFKPFLNRFQFAQL